MTSTTAMTTTIRNVRIRIVLSLVFVTPLGFLFKLYAGPGRWWPNDYGAGVLYEVFWVLCVFFLWPRRALLKRVPFGVFAATACLEVLQLWHPVLLERARSTFLGAAVLGTTFSWWDFPHYVLGCWLGWLWIRLLCNSGCAP